MRTNGCLNLRRLPYHWAQQNESNCNTSCTVIVRLNKPDCEFDAKVNDFCHGCRSAMEHAAAGERTVSIDEMTGIQANVGEIRTETDYLQHFQQLVATDTNASKWHLVMDCLSTDQSESLVRWVVQVEGLEIDLGVKGKSGILQSMQTTFSVDR